MVLASAIADIIKSRTDSLLKKTKTAVSSKPIVMRAEYAHCPNLTIIDTPGFVLKVGVLCYIVYTYLGTNSFGILICCILVLVMCYVFCF